MRRRDLAKMFAAGGAAALVPSTSRADGPVELFAVEGDEEHADGPLVLREIIKERLDWRRRQRAIAGDRREWDAAAEADTAASELEWVLQQIGENMTVDETRVFEESVTFAENATFDKDVYVGGDIVVMGTLTTVGHNVR